MKKILLMTLSAVMGMTGLKAQTWPATPHDLAASDFSFTSWPAASAANTYPAAMRFYFLGNTGDPLAADTIAEDYAGAYNLTSGTRMNGVGTDGFSFINTGSSNLSANGYKLGAAVLALNTTGRAGVQVSWTGKTIVPNNRTFLVRLYYRVGNTGAWNPVMDGTNYVEYARNNTAGHTQNISAVTLPAAVNNQALVQLEWKYFMADTNTATGARPQLAVTNINVSSISLSAVSRIHTNVTVLDFHSRVGVSSSIDSVMISGGNIATAIDILAAAPFEISETYAGTYGTAISVPSAGDTVTPRYIYVKYTPVAAGTDNGTISLVSGLAVQNVALAGTAYASSDPAPVALKTNTYTFTEWDPAAPAATYPEHTVFHYTTASNPKPTNLPLAGDWHCGYDLTSRPRFNGLEDNGVSFINTGSAQYDDCVSGSNNNNVYVGGIVVGLNTQEVDSVVLDYTLQLLTRGDGTVAREYEVRLQYRTGTDADFEDFAVPVVFSSENRPELDSVRVSFSLDAALLNRPGMQLRWLYCELDVPGAGGSRPAFRLDDVQVKGYIRPISVRELGNKGVTFYPNPVKPGQDLVFDRPVSGKVYDLTGRALKIFTDATALATEDLHTGMYIIRTTDGGIARFIVE